MVAGDSVMAGDSVVADASVVAEASVVAGTSVAATVSGADSAGTAASSSDPAHAATTTRVAKNNPSGLERIDASSPGSAQWIQFSRIGYVARYRVSSLGGVEPSTTTVPSATSLTRWASTLRRAGLCSSRRTST